MSTLLIEGGRRLSGTVEVEGNKNAALPLLAACLLTPEVCVLQNVPRIADVEVMARLLLDLGAEVEGIGSTTLRIRCLTVVKDEPDPSLVVRLRGSVLLLGPLLARRCAARLARSGGDSSARRASGRRRSASKAERSCTAPSTGCGATTSKRAAGRSSARLPAATSTSAAPGPRIWKWSRRC